MSVTELVLYKRASKLAHRVCSVLGIATIFGVFMAPSAITVIGALIGVYIFGNMAVGSDVLANEVKCALAKKINS